MAKLEFCAEYSVDEFRYLTERRQFTSSIWQRVGCGSGVYFLYGSEVLLYVGWSINLNERIGTHINGSSINTAHFHQEIEKFGIIGSDAFEKLFQKYPDCKDIEHYLIKKLKPKYNGCSSNFYRKRWW